MGNKKIGNLIEMDESSEADTGCIVWASIWNSTYDGKTLVTIFFTRQDNPRYYSWFKSICDVPVHGHWNIVQKGTYMHGFYSKISITTSLDDSQDLLDRLQKWKYKSDDGIKYGIEFTKDIDTVYTELLAKAI